MSNIKSGDLVRTIQSNRSKRTQAQRIIESNPNVVTVTSKLVADKQIAKEITADDRININRGMLEEIHTKIRNNKTNNKNIIKLFPDIELSIQILVSSILSPKKLTDVALVYKLKQGFSVSSQVMTDVLEVIHDYINEEYDLENKLPEIVREALFDSGSYPVAVIPEASVDETINTDLLATFSTESFRTKVDGLISSMTSPIGIFSPRTTEPVQLEAAPSAENFVRYLASESLIRMTDNPGLLSFNAIKDKVTSCLIREVSRKGVSVAAETRDKLEYMDIFRTRGNAANGKTVEILKQKNETRRRSIGKPMIMKLPSESVCPVFVPGSPSDHIGYLVLLDESGKPLTTDGNPHTMLNQPTNGIYTSGMAANSTIQKAFNGLIADQNTNVDVNSLFEMYRSILERQIYTTMKGSLYGNNVEISNRNDIYFLMFTRALAEQKTNMLYIPKSMMTYFAFNYTDLGVGESLLDSLSIQSSLRAILKFSRVMAIAKQAIDVTNVNVTLDPRDKDPEKTIEQIQDFCVKMRQNYFPLGMNNPVDLTNWIQRAGLQFNFTNNSNIPNVEISYENSNIQHTVPDGDAEEDLRKETIMALGLSPEAVDSGFNPEFAVSVVNNNVLLAKRVALYQQTLTKLLDHYLSTILYNDESIRTKIREYIRSNIDAIKESTTEEETAIGAQSKEQLIEYYLDKFAEHVYIELPKPENNDIMALSVEFDLYKDNLEKVLDSVISTDIFSENVAGNLSEHVDTIKNIYKHYLLRNWMAENNYYTEVLDIADIGDEEQTKILLDAIKVHMTGTMSNADHLLTMLQEYKKAVNKDLEKVQGDGSEDSSGSSSSSDSSSEEEGGEGEGGGEEENFSLDF